MCFYCVNRVTKLGHNCQLLVVKNVFLVGDVTRSYAGVKRRTRVTYGRIAEGANVTSIRVASLPLIDASSCI